MLSDLWPPYGQWAPVPVPGEPESWAPDLWATPSSRPWSPLRSHLAGALLSRLHSRTALLGAGGVQAVGLPWGKFLWLFVKTKMPLHTFHPLSFSPILSGNIRDHPQKGEGQEVHGRYERTVLEPPAGRASAQRLAQRQTRDSDRPLPAQPHWHAAGLWGRDADVLRRRANQAPRLPLHLQPGAVPRLLDRRGGQHHPLLYVSRLLKWTKIRCSVINRGSSSTNAEEVFYQSVFSGQPFYIKWRWRSDCNGFYSTKKMPPRLWLVYTVYSWLWKWLNSNFFLEQNLVFLFYFKAIST